MMQKFIDKVIEYWEKNGRESNTYIALQWLQARIRTLEAEIDANKAQSFIKEVEKHIDSKSAPRYSRQGVQYVPRDASIYMDDLY